MKIFFSNFSTLFFAIALFGFVGCNNSQFSSSSSVEKEPSKKVEKTADAVGEPSKEETPPPLPPKEEPKVVIEEPEEKEPEVEPLPGLGGPMPYAGYCTALNTEKTVQEVTFPTRRGCPWGQLGNLDRRDGHVTARVRQRDTIDLPDNAALCNIALKSKTANLYFDDHVMLLIGEYLLVTSLKGAVGLMPKTPGLRPIPIWQWYKENSFGLVGTRHDNNSVGTWCLNPDQCVVPKSESGGKFDLALNAHFLKDISDTVTKNGSLEFSLVTTGDDNGSDCGHSGLTLNAEVEYVILESPIAK